LSLLTGTLGFPIISTLAPFWMTTVLGLGAVGWTFMGWAWGLGAVGATVYLSTRGHSRGLGWTVVLSAAAFGLSLVLFGMTRSVPIAAVFWCLNGACFTTNMISSASLLQMIVESAYVGRVMSLRMVSSAFNQLAAWPLGAVADGFGVDEINIVPWPILLRRRLARKVGIDRRWAIVMVLLSGLFTVGFTITILVVSLERIATDLNSDVVTMNWSITGPMLAFGVVGPAFGKAGDLWGHKGLFVGALVGAGVFAIATALAWNAWSMIAFRTLSTSAGSACGPAAMAYINRLFAPTERVKPLSYWSFVGAGAPVIGVVAGAAQPLGALARHDARIVDRI